MLLLLDLDKKLIVVSAGSSAALRTVEGKRGRGEEVAVQTIVAGEVGEMPAGGSLRFVAKEEGKYDTDPLVAVEGVSFVWDAVSQLYRAPIDWVTAAVDALFHVDGTPENDLASIRLGIEVGYKGSGDTYWKRNVNDVILILRNNYLRDEEGTPAPGVPPLQSLWMKQPMTAYTGGAAGAVDSLVTVGVDLPRIVWSEVAGEVKGWRLAEDDTPPAEDPDSGVILPDDHDPVDNPKVWLQFF